MLEMICFYGRWLERNESWWTNDNLSGPDATTVPVLEKNSPRFLSFFCVVLHSVHLCYQKPIRGFLFVCQWLLAHWIIPHFYGVFWHGLYSHEQKKKKPSIEEAFFSAALWWYHKGHFHPRGVKNKNRKLHGLCFRALFRVQGFSGLFLLEVTSAFIIVLCFYRSILWDWKESQACKKKKLLFEIVGSWSPI